MSNGNEVDELMVKAGHLDAYPTSQANYVTQAIKLCEFTMITPWGGVIMSCTDDDPQWHIYLLDGQHIGKCLITKGNRYTAAISDAIRTDQTEDDERAEYASLLRLLEYLLVANDTPVEVKKALVRSETDLRQILAIEDEKEEVTEP